MSSILGSTKKNLGLETSYTAFDPDVIIHINSVFATLAQLGIGPSQGFMIEGYDETWDAFLDHDLNLNSVKTYMYLRVRLLFDPPTTSYLLTALEKQIQEFEWRLNVYREGLAWAPSIDDHVIDGGQP